MAREIIDDLLPSLKRVFLEQGGLRHFLREVIQVAMSTEVEEHVRAGPHQRTAERQGYRNGNKPRRLQARIGELELSVPQVRGCDPCHPSAFGKWQRSERALLVACGFAWFRHGWREHAERAECSGGDVRRRNLGNDGEPGGGRVGRETGCVPRSPAGPRELAVIADGRWRARTCWRT